jgi:hypothetical protein
MRSSSQRLWTTFSASFSDFSIIMTFKVFAVLTDSTFEYPPLVIRSLQIVSPSGSSMYGLFSIVTITRNFDMVFDISNNKDEVNGIGFKHI